MKFKLPQFQPGKPGTLLDAENAETVRRFLNAFQNIEIIEGETNQVLISDNNVKIVIKQSSSSFSRRKIPATLTIAGILPTVTEIRTAIEGAYSASSLTPEEGDLVFMDEFNFEVSESSDVNGIGITANDIFRVYFEVGGTWYLAFQMGPSRLI